MLRCISYCRHYSCRCGEHQGAGTKHNQYRDGPYYFTRHGPGDCGCTQSNYYYPCSPTVSQPHYFGFARVSRLYKTYHTLYRTVLTDTGGSHIKGAKAVHRAGAGFVACRFVNRQALAGHDRLIDRGLASNDDAVYRYALTREHAQYISDSNLLSRYYLLTAALNAPRRLRRELNQALYACPGLGHGQILQQCAQLHDKSYLSRSKVLPCSYGGYERQGYEHVCLNVKDGYQSHYCFQYDRHAAEYDSCPGGIKRQVHKVEQAYNKRNSPYRQKDYFAPGAAPFTYCFQDAGYFVPQLSHYITSYTYRGIGI